MALIPPENTLGIAVISVGAVFGFLAIAAYALRIWAHHIQKTGLRLSDYLCGAGLVRPDLYAMKLMWIMQPMLTFTTQGLGRDVTTVTQQEIINFEKGLVAGTFLWITSNTCVRCAILLLYIQLFPGPRFRPLCYGVLGLNLVFVLVWDLSLHGSCGDVRSFYLFLPIFNLFSDITVVVLPLPILWRLQMSRSKKLGLTAIFGVGIGICVITLLRIIDTARADLSNPTKSDAVFGLLGLLEPFLGVIDACVPFLKPVFKRLMTSTKGGSYSTQDDSWPQSKTKYANRGVSGRSESFQRLDDTTDSELGGIGLTSYTSTGSRGKLAEPEVCHEDTGTGGAKARTERPGSGGFAGMDGNGTTTHEL
ncbi:MAG: hypothetical protein Q9218_006272 [Villophora microphyllina]